MQILDLKDVYEDCTPVSAQWQDLGIRLGVARSTIEVIQIQNPYSTRNCLSALIDEWLKRGGDPTWTSLCKALFHINPALAETISQKHDCNYISSAGRLWQMMEHLYANYFLYYKNSL